MSLENFFKRLDKDKIKYFIVKIDKKSVGESLDAIIFPDKGIMTLLINLSNETGKENYRVQPYDSDLVSIKAFQQKLTKSQALLFHDDFKDYLFLSDLNYVDRCLQEKKTDGDGRRSVRLPWLQKGDLERLRNGEDIMPAGSSLTGKYIPYANLWSNLFENVQKNAVITQKQSTTLKFTPLNIILYGPSGTGKTRGAVLIAEKIFQGDKFPPSSTEIQNVSVKVDNSITDSDNWYSVQFHPSFSYEDFFEGLRPVQIQLNGKSEVSYEVVPGVFKVISQLARASLEPGKFSIEVKAIFENGSLKQWLDSEGSIAELYRFKSRDGYFEVKNEKIFQTGKNANEIKKYENNGPYEGVAAVRWFSSNTSPEQFILFIDELNRGNPAKIFGEALSLVETTKRYGTDETSYVSLPYSHERFSVPSNLSIIGAMNSSDKTLAHLDQAFRRRFKFIYFSPNFEFIKSDSFIDKSLKGSIKREIVLSVADYFETINESLNDVDISVDNHIGHSYALDVLRRAQSFIEDVNKNADQNKLIATLMARFWEFELHGLLRDILGQHNVEEFVEKFYERISKKKDTFLFLTVDEKLKVSLKKYLLGAAPENIGSIFKDAA